MHTITNALSIFASSAIGSILTAVALLIVAFIVAAIARSIAVKLLGKTKLQEILAKPGSAQATAGLIGKFVYLLVFLLFVPSIFSTLGISSVSSVITDVLNQIWGYVPNVVACAIVLMVGFLVAKLVRQLLVPLFNKLKIDKLQEKAGIEVDDKNKLSVTLSYIVYVLILVPVVIMALDVLNIAVISTPAKAVLSQIIGFIPRILVAAIVLAVGYIIAKFAAQVIERLLAATGIDARFSGVLGEKARSVRLTKAIGIAARVVILIFFAVEAVNTLQLAVLTSIGTAVIGYLPAAISAILVLAIAFFAAMFVEKLMKNGVAKSCVLPAKIAIYAVGVFFALSQLGVASEMVNAAFILIIAAACIAFALAFGLGGRACAARILERLDKKALDAKQEKTDAKD